MSSLLEGILQSRATALISGASASGAEVLEALSALGMPAAAIDLDASFGAAERSRVASARAEGKPLVFRVGATPSSEQLDLIAREVASADAEPSDTRSPVLLLCRAERPDPALSRLFTLELPASRLLAAR